MIDQDSRANWGTARLLFTGHLALLLIVWLVFALGVAAVLLGIAVFGRVGGSGWDYAGAVVRLPAAIYGYYLIHDVLPAHVAHGQTRRGYLAQAGLFVAVAGVLYTGLIVLGYWLEGLAYRAAGWPQTFGGDRLYDAPDQYATIALVHLLVLLGWAVAGGVLGAGAARSTDAGLATLLPAVLIVGGISLLVGSNGLPLIGRFLATDLAVGAIGLLGTLIVAAGAALTWAVARHLPIRPRTG